MQPPEPATRQAQSGFIFTRRDILLAVLSLALQVSLGLFLGHAYDMPIFMATGVLAGGGQNPYIPTDLSEGFHTEAFQGIPSFGYPPPWALVLGAIYNGTYRMLPNFLLYNLALKLPVIAGNFLLAALVVRILKRFGVEEKTARRAWLFLLFNPFFLLTTSTWGQFDSIVALFCLLSLVLLWEERWVPSAVLLALAISLKPTPLPLLVVALIFLMSRSARERLMYLAGFSAALFVFCIAPFLLFQWDPSPILEGWNFHFRMAGGLSFMTFLEYTQWTVQLPGAWWFLGWLWIPALGIAAPAMRRIEGFDDLLKKSAALTLVFFLSRAWLSETNLNLVLPLLLILVSIRQLERYALSVTWGLALAFSFVNTSIAQLLFPSLPGLMDSFLEMAVEFFTTRYFLRTVLVVLWMAAGGWVAWRCFRKTERTYSWS